MAAMFRSSAIRTGFVSRGQLSLRYFHAPLPLQNRFTDLVKRVRDSYPIQEITAQDLRAAIASPRKPVVIDVREPDETARGTIVGAHEIPRGVLDRDIETKLVTIEEVNTDSNEGKEVVVYCQGGVRSILAAETLIRLGFKQEKVKSLRGGYEEWKSSGFEVTKK